MADPWGAAQANVALKYDPQENALNRQLTNLQSQTAANEAGINQYGTGGRAGINDVYNTLNSLLTTNRAQSAADLANTSSQIGAGYDTGIQYTNAVANASRQRLSDLARQVGAGAGGELEVLSPFEQTINQILGAQNLAKSNAVGNTQNWASKWDQIFGQGINIGEQTRSDRLARFETELMRMLGENKLSGLQGQNQIYGKLSDMLGMRQNDLIASYNQLVQQEWENQYKQAALDQQAASANADLAYKYAALGQNASQFSASQASKGQLSMSDIIDAVMAQNKLDAAGQQQGFENNLALNRFDLDTRKQNWTENTWQAPTDPKQSLVNDIYKANYIPDDPDANAELMEGLLRDFGIRSQSDQLMDAAIPYMMGNNFGGLNQTPDYFSFNNSGGGGASAGLPSTYSGMPTAGAAQYGGIGSLLQNRGRTFNFR